MGERNLMPTSSGQAAFSILLFQDVAAIPILALLPLLGVAALPTDGAVATNPALEAAVDGQRGVHHNFSGAKVRGSEEKSVYASTGPWTYS